jgi:subtilisin family serine protease
VANISYAFSDSPVVKTAADYFRSKGGVVAMAAGNEGLRLTFADNPSVLTVSAIGSDEVVPSWSNRGLPIDFAAPGNGIYSTVSGGQYNVVSGTSFSAPCVAGVAALVISVNPNLRALEIESILKRAVDDLGTPGWDELYGYGLINAQKAVNLALTPDLPTSTDNTPPTVTITSPAAGTQLDRKVTVKVAASDDVGVTKVELLADGKIIGTSTQASPSFTWNTSKLAKGTHKLQARAYDAAGNGASSSVVTVTK